MLDFRKSLIAGAEAAHAAGTLSLNELRTLRIVTLRLKNLARMEQATHELVAAEGLVSAVDASGKVDWSKFDWSKAYEFIKMLVAIFA